MAQHTPYVPHNRKVTAGEPEEVRVGPTVKEAARLARRQESKSPDAKAFWQDSWGRNYGLYEAALLEAVEADRQANWRCPSCHALVPVRYPDTRARTDAVRVLHELAGLRPKPEEAAQADTHVVRRLVLPDGFELEGEGAPGQGPTLPPAGGEGGA